MAGEGVMLEMVNELWSSFAEGQAFEGDMLRLTQVGRLCGRPSLACLGATCGAAGSAAWAALACAYACGRSCAVPAVAEHIATA